MCIGLGKYARCRSMSETSNKLPVREHNNNGARSLRVASRGDVPAARGRYRPVVAANLPESAAGTGGGVRTWNYERT